MPASSVASVAVATDFSARADRAIDRASQLADQMGARLRVIHALPQADTESADRAELDRKMHECVGRDASCNVEFVYPEGSPPKAIAGASDSDDVVMLVLGPARYNSLGDYFLGTAVDYVLRHTSKPVLVVKNRARGPYLSIVAGTDFSIGSAHAFITAASLFPDTPIHIVHVWHVPFEGWQKDRYVADEIEKGEEAKMKTFLDYLIGRQPRLADATSQLVRGSALKAIREGLALDPTALVVLGSHGESGFRQAAIGSVTSDLLRYVDTDILVVNTRDAQA